MTTMSSSNPQTSSSLPSTHCVPVRRLVAVSPPQSLSILDGKSLKPMRIDNWASFFLGRLHDLFKSELEVDLVLVFPKQSQTIKVHSLVLNACTDYFTKLEAQQEANNELPVDGTRRLLMPAHVEKEALLPVITFLYSGKLVVEQGLFSKVRAVVDKLRLGVLAKVMDAQLQQEVLQQQRRQESTQQRSNSKQSQGEVGGRNQNSGVSLQQIDKQTKQQSRLLSYREWRRQSSGEARSVTNEVQTSGTNINSEASRLSGTNESVNNVVRRGLKRKRSEVFHESIVALNNEASFDRICQMTPRNEEEIAVLPSDDACENETTSDEELELSCVEPSEREFLQEQQKRVMACSSQEVEDDIYEDNTEESEFFSRTHVLEDFESSTDDHSYRDSAKNSLQTAKESEVDERRSILKTRMTKEVAPVKRSVRFSLRPSPTKKVVHSAQIEAETNLSSNSAPPKQALSGSQIVQAVSDAEVTLLNSSMQDTPHDLHSSELPLDIRDDVHRSDQVDKEQTIFSQQSVRINKMALIRKVLQASPNLKGAKKVRIKIVKRDAQGKEVHQMLRVTSKCRKSDSKVLKPLPSTESPAVSEKTEETQLTIQSSEADSLFQVASGIATSLGINSGEFEQNEATQHHEVLEEQNLSVEVTAATNMDRQANDHMAVDCNKSVQ